LGFSPERAFGRKPLGEPLLILPRRDELAWTKIAIHPHCSTPERSKLHLEQHTKHIHFKAAPYDHQRHITEPITGKICSKQESLASLTWKELTGTLIRNSEHHSPTDRPNN